MARFKPPFAATKKGFSFNLGPEERHVVRRLIGEVGELLKTSAADDPKMARLFPPAYSADEEAEKASSWANVSSPTESSAKNSSTC